MLTSNHKDCRLFSASTHFCFTGCLRLQNLQVASIIGSGVELLYTLLTTTPGSHFSFNSGKVAVTYYFSP